MMNATELGSPTLAEMQVRTETTYQRLSREKRVLLDMYEHPMSTNDSLRRDIRLIADTSQFFPDRYKAGLTAVQQDLSDMESNIDQIFAKSEYPLSLKRHILREMYAQNTKAKAGNPSLDQIIYNALDSSLSMKKITGEYNSGESGANFESNIVLTKAIGYLLMDKSLSPVELEERLNLIHRSLRKHINLLGVKVDEENPFDPEKEVYGLIAPIANNALALHHVADVLTASGQSAEHIETFFPEAIWDARMGIDGVAFENGKFAALVQSTTAKKNDYSFKPVELVVKTKSGELVKKIEFPVHMFDVMDDIPEMKAMFSFTKPLKELMREIPLIDKGDGRKAVSKDHKYSARLPIPNDSMRKSEFKFIDFMKQLAIFTSPGKSLSEVLTQGTDNPQVMYNVGIVPQRVETPDAASSLLMNVGQYIRNP